MQESETGPQQQQNEQQQQEHKLSPRDAISQLHASSISQLRLLREFMNYKSWLAPATLDPRGNVVASHVRGMSDSRHYLLVYSDRQALEEDTRVSGWEPRQALEFSGYSVFQQVHPEIAAVCVNRNSSSEMVFKRQQVLVLRNWARAVSIEQVIKKIREDRVTGIEQLRQFDRFIVLCQHGQNEDFQIAMAPDTKDRQLIAAFTAEDACEAFMNSLKPVLTEEAWNMLDPYTFTGEQLFSTMKKMQVDGIVFNCLGPTVPVLLSHTFIDSALAGDVQKE